MRTRLSRSEPPSIAIPTYLAFCVLVCGFLGWGFYKLMQPAQYPNPGVAAYKPPPAIATIYLPTVPFRDKGSVSPPPTDSALHPSADETTGRTIQNVEPAPTAVPPPATQVKKARNEEHIKRAREARRTVPIQSHPSGAYAAAYPGYAALH
jgi:hypothetical protein